MTKIEFPAELKRALTSTPGLVCTAIEINGVCSVVAKLPKSDIRGFDGPIPIGYRAEAGFYPTAAVIRLALDIFDRPDEPFGLEVFFNVADPADLAAARRLSEQDVIDIHFADMAGRYAGLSKQVRHREPHKSEVAAMIDQAVAYNATLAVVDFGPAKAAMMQERPLGL